MSRIDLTVPDLGNFDEVAVVDVLVKVGDKIEIETPLVTLETDKATMDVPSTAAGTVTEVLVQKGGQIAKGGLIALLHGDLEHGAGRVDGTSMVALSVSSVTSGVST